MERKNSRWSSISFALLFLGVLILFLFVIGPFLIPVLMAVFTVVLLYPANDALAEKLGGKQRTAAAISTLLVLLVIVVPTVGLLYLFVLQGIELMGQVEDLLGPDGLGTLLGGNAPEPLRPLMERLEEFGVREQLRKLVSGAAGAIAKNVAGVLSATANLVVAVFLGFLSIYYFFAEGHHLVRGLLAASPLEERYMGEFFQEVRNASQTMIVVNLLTGVAQGLVGVVSFIIVGLPSPVVWAALMALFSFVPMVGTGLIWFPAGVILILTGRPIAGAFILAWGVLVIGTVDNLLRPFLAKGRMDLHPLLIFVTIFGGIATFGFIGVVLGPMIGSIFTAMIRIWKRDFVPRLAP